MYLGLPDPHPDQLVTSTDPAPDPDPSSKKTLISTVFFTFNDFLPVFRIRIRIRTEMSRSTTLLERKQSLIEKGVHSYVHCL
jgi:hypothetical protein